MNNEELKQAMKNFFLVEKIFKNDSTNDIDEEFLKQASEYRNVFRNNISKCYAKLSESIELRRFLKEYGNANNSKLSATSIKKLVLDQLIDVLFYLSFGREEDMYNEAGLNLIYANLLTGNLMSDYGKMVSHFVSNNWYANEANNASPIDLGSIYLALYFNGALKKDDEVMDDYLRKIKSLPTLSPLEVGSAILLENDTIMNPSEDMMSNVNEYLALEEETKPYLDKYFPALNQEELTNYYENIASPYLFAHKDDYEEQMKEAGSFNYFITYIRNYVSTLSSDNNDELLDNVWASACIFALLLAKAFYSEELDERINERNLAIFKEIFASNPICKSYLELATEICGDDESEEHPENVAVILSVLLAMDDVGVKEDLSEAIKEMAGYGLEEFKDKNVEQLTGWNELLTWENPVMVANLAYTFVYGYLISPIYVASSTAFINYAFLTLEVIFEESEGYEEELG